MLTRQLASAGSGKTYTLARQFIRLFLTAPEGEPGSGTGRRLRNRPELHEALRGILAVTFTNKATGEMKERIISKLAAIANYRAHHNEPVTAEEAEAERKRIKRIDYLADLVNETGEDPEKVARTAREGIDILLNEFSDFQVSTIDSFFQLVMRTFTYEADLPDNFQIELDSKYVAGLGLDTALVELHTRRSTPAFRYWTRKTVETEQRRSGSWNIYTPGRNTLYSKIHSMIQTMESETFKEKLQLLREYFDGLENQGDPETGGLLGDIYEHYEAKYTAPLKTSAEKLKKAASEALSYAERNGIDTKDMAQHLYGRLRKMEKISWRICPEESFGPDDFRKPSAMKKGLDCDSGFLSRVHRVGDAYEYFLSLIENKAFRSWIIYSDSFRNLALLWEIKKKIDELMIDANSIQLSDTNTILHRIIGDDETPFIYERLGTRLNHYLIDEFQDTSRLQWINTLPLLRESESRGEENLIIGDPKQSIYRFRNADSSLITTAVKKAFPDLHDAGNDPNTNTNWRSDLNIVRFNNTLFHYLADTGMDLTASYGDVIQFSNKYDPEDPEKSKGYVKITFYKKTTDKNREGVGDDDDEEEDSKDYPEYYSEIGHIITDLLSRGYRQKDIAVLVLTHKAGARVINALLDFNSKIDREDPDALEPIRFVSDDSLKVKNAKGVKIVIEALKAIVGIGPFTRPAVLDDNGNEVLEVEEDPVTLFAKFANKDLPYISDELNVMLGKMAVMSLPSIVEQVIGTFVPKKVRDMEAPFLSAFQDKVVEFCEGHMADPASFLKWWDKRGDSLSITSPESTDAVQVATVHSSKGLEFGAVIVPDATYRFTPAPNKIETVWAQSAMPEDPGFPLPPIMPFETRKGLTGTYHEQALDEFKSNTATDQLNAAYVALTRAVHELHILTDASTAKPKEVSANFPPFNSLAQGLVMLPDNLEDVIDRLPHTKFPYIIHPNQLLVDTSEKRSETDPNLTKSLEITYGSPVVIEKQGTDKEEPGESLTMVESYRVTDTLPTLHARLESPLMTVDDSEEEDDSESDVTGAEEVDSETPLIRSEEEAKAVEGEEDEYETAEEDELIPGSEKALMRELLLRLHSTRDLKRAILRLRVSGRWTESQLEFIEKVVSRLIESEESRSWFFPPEGWTVYTGRPLIHRRRKTRTPDRIMISPEGDRAILINFKMTPASDEGEWRQLRAHIRAFRRTGFTGRIEAWLSHPLSGLKEPLLPKA